jgi:hypothetical protein
MPVGPANLSLLREAASAAKQGLPVLLFAPPLPDSQILPEESLSDEDKLLHQTGIALRDYTNGEGLKLVREMLQSGAMVVDSLGKTVEIAKQYAFTPPPF